jgi:hypothetical protein
MYATIPRSLVGVAVIFLLFSGLACGRDSHEVVRNGAFEWDVISELSPRTIEIGGDIGYCVGRAKPRIAKPNIVYRGSDVYISLKLEHRHRLPRKARCMGVGLLVKRAVRLRRDLADLRLYDSGVDPPQQRWPVE